MNWKFDFSPDTSDMMGNWSLGERRLVVLLVVSEAVVGKLGGAERSRRQSFLLVGCNVG